MGHHFHHPHQQQQRRGHPGRHFIFRQNGRTFVFTEEEYYAQQQQNFHHQQQQFYEPSVFDANFIIPILKNLIIFGIIWFILRVAMDNSGDEKEEDGAPRSSPPYTPSRPPSSAPPKETKSTYSEFSTHEDDDSDDHHRSYSQYSGNNNNNNTRNRNSDRQNNNNNNSDNNDKSAKGELTSFKHSERARSHAPHLNYFEVRYLKQRGRRHVIFLPRNMDNMLEWQTYEQIALNFIHDRLSFYWLSEKHERKWRDFIQLEFETFNNNGDIPLAIVFGGTSGSKRTCFYCSEEDLPVTPIGSLKDRLSRWLEAIVEGTEELSYTDCDIPPEDY
jgi:hypothetical protein